MAVDKDELMREAAGARGEEVDLEPGSEEEEAGEVEASAEADDEAEAEEPKVEDPYAELRAEFDQKLEERDRKANERFQVLKKRLRASRNENQALRRMMNQRSELEGRDELPENVEVQYDDDGKAYVPRAALRPQPSAPTPDPEQANAQAKAAYESVKRREISRDEGAEEVFDRLEEASQEFVQAAVSAAQAGESLATPDLVLDWAESSGVADELIESYPELEGRLEDFIEAVRTPAGVRKIVREIRKAAKPSGKTERGPEREPEPQPRKDTAAEAREKLRGKARQDVRGKGRTAENLTLAEASSMSGEEMLELRRTDPKRYKQLQQESGRGL